MITVGMLSEVYTGLWDMAERQIISRLLMKQNWVSMQSLERHPGWT